MVKVVATKEVRQRIKFSKVSFLGPLSEMGSFKVGIGPRERTFLEKRNLERSQRQLGAMAPLGPSPGRLMQGRETGSRLGDKSMTPRIEDALSGFKLEPV